MCARSQALACTNTRSLRSDAAYQRCAIAAGLCPALARLCELTYAKTERTLRPRTLIESGLTCLSTRNLNRPTADQAPGTMTRHMFAQGCQLNANPPRCAAGCYSAGAANPDCQLRFGTASRCVENNKLTRHINYNRPQQPEGLEVPGGPQMRQAPDNTRPRMHKTSSLSARMICIGAGYCSGDCCHFKEKEIPFL